MHYPHFVKYFGPLSGLEEGLKAIQQSMNEQMGGIKLMVANLMERQSNYEARTSGGRARSLSGTIGGTNGIPSPRLSQNPSILISEASREEHSHLGFLSRPKGFCRWAAQ